MEIPDQLLCLYSAEVTERDGSYVLEVPDREVGVGDLAVGQSYRVALLPTDGSPEEATERRDADSSEPSPPVEEGEVREVDIQDIGEQGDGIARVERGYVVIVPDTEQGERVTVEVTDVQENVSFAEVIERQSHF